MPSTLETWSPCSIPQARCWEMCRLRPCAPPRLTIARYLVKVRTRRYAKQITGIRVQEPRVGEPLEQYVERIDDDTVVCRCERVTAAEVRALIRRGFRDVNEIKAVTRAGMGACGSKTCASLIRRLFRDEGIPDAEVVDGVKRPLFMEVPLGLFAGMTEVTHD